MEASVSMSKWKGPGHLLTLLTASRSHNSTSSFPFQRSSCSSKSPVPGQTASMTEEDDLRNTASDSSKINLNAVPTSPARSAVTKRDACMNVSCQSFTMKKLNPEQLLS